MSMSIRIVVPPNINNTSKIQKKYLRVTLFAIYLPICRLLVLHIICWSLWPGTSELIIN